MFMTKNLKIIMLNEDYLQKNRCIYYLKTGELVMINTCVKTITTQMDNFKIPISFGEGRYKMRDLNGICDNS